MKLPSVRVLVEESRRTLARFTVVLAVALLGTIAALILAERAEEPTPWQDVLIRILMSASLGISLVTAFAVAVEKQGWSRRASLATQLGGILLLAGYYVTLPAIMTTAAELHFFRFALFLLGTHLLAAVLPFAARGETSPFWEYNKTLFLRFLTACLYTCVLYAGLSVALLAIQKLFDLTIDGERYFQLWIFLCGVFNTWFFLAGVPRDLRALESERAYPKGLKVFTQFVLIPLVLIYLVILYAYTVKIIIDWEWPVGWVAYLVLGFSITGIFSILLVHPIVDRPENGFIRVFSRRYYLALVPMLILLFLAIWRRISEYGITERRYFVLVLAVWLAGVVLYFLVSRRRSIKIIPASLCILAFGTSFGPWGAFSVSERSQLERLSGYLTANRILVDGKVQRAPSEVSLADARNITSIVRYLDDTHGLSSLQTWFDVDLDTVGGVTPDERRTGSDRGKHPRAIAALMGVRYVEEWESTQLKFSDFTASQRQAVSIAGFDQMVRLGWFGWVDRRMPIQIYEEGWEMRFSVKRRTLVIARMDAPPDSVVFDLQAFATTLEKEQRGRSASEGIPVSRMALDGSAGSLRLRLLFSDFQCAIEKDTVRFSNGSADLLVAKAAP